MKKLTPIQASARGEECTIQIQGICNNNPATTVLCHAPYHGRFGSRKSDWWAAYGCSSCHDAIDGRDRMACANLDYRLYWHDAIHETHVKLIEKGLLTFEGVEVEPLPKTLPRR